MSRPDVVQKYYDRMGVNVLSMFTPPARTNSDHKRRFMI